MSTSKAGFGRLAPAQAPIEASAEAVVSALESLGATLRAQKMAVDGPHAVDATTGYGAGGWLAAGDILVIAVQPLGLTDARPSASGDDESAEGAAAANLVAFSQARNVRIVGGNIGGLELRVNAHYPAGSRPLTAAEVSERADRMQRRSRSKR